MLLQDIVLSKMNLERMKIQLHEVVRYSNTYFLNNFP